MVLTGQLSCWSVGCRVGLSAVVMTSQLWCWLHSGIVSVFKFFTPAYCLLPVTYRQNAKFWETWGNFTVWNSKLAFGTASEV